MALTIAQLNTHSHEYFEDLVMEQVFELNPALKIMREQENINFSGGTSLQFPIQYKELGQSKSVDPDDARATTLVETLTGGALDWKYTVCDVIISWQEAVSNGADGKIVDLISYKAKEGAADLAELLADQLFQTLAATGTRDFQGLYSALRTTSTSYAGISDADASSWACSLYETSAISLALFGTNSMAYAMRTCYWRGYPDVIFTTLALAETYASKLQPSERREPESGKSGATNLYFMGAPMIIDTHVASSNMIFAKKEHLNMYLHEGDNITADGWERDPEQISGSIKDANSGKPRTGNPEQGRKAMCRDFTRPMLMAA